MSRKLTLCIHYELLANYECTLTVALNPVPTTED